MTVIVALGIVGVFAQQNVEWPNITGGYSSTRYAAIDQINASNVGGLRIAWRRAAVDPQLKVLDPALTSPNNFRATPLMIDGVLYSPNGVGLVEAFHPGTGETIWVQQPPGGVKGLTGDSTRGLGYWQDGAEARLFVQRGDTLTALDPLAWVTVGCAAALTWLAAEGIGRLAFRRARAESSRA